MYRSAPPVRGRLAAAVTVSVLLHALAGLGWWATQERYASASPAFATTVEGPEDAETVFVLRDPPPARPRPLPPAVTAPVSPVPPPVIPAAHAGTGPKAPDRSALPQPGTSHGGEGSLPKSAGTKPLHPSLRSGQSIVYVLDCSSSMGADGLLPAATAAVKASLAALGPDVRFQVVAYNGAAAPLASELLPATPSNVRRAEGWLDQLRAEGRSDHVAGLREALWFQPGAVFLLTDADDLGEDEARRIVKLVRGPLRLSAAIFGSRRSAGTTPLERLVRNHGGTVQYMGQ